MRIVSYVTLLAVAVAIPVHGADTGITGLELVLRARGANEKLVFVSKDPALKQGRVLKITAKDVPLSLATPLGSVGVWVTTGSLRSCALVDAPAVATDVAGSFVARDALDPPADCSDAALGRPSVCGNGVVEPGEACDAHRSHPGHVLPAQLPDERRS